MSNKKIVIICSSDGTGRGWVDLIKRQNPEIETYLALKPEEPKEELSQEELEKEEEWFNLFGEGMIEKIDLDWAMENLTGKGAYWIFDLNNLWEYSEKLRKLGEKVFGATGFTNRMENDRNFAVEIAKKSGLNSPPTFEFTDIGKAMDFLEQNEDTAYVFKPDGAEESYLTFVPNSEQPEKANNELRDYLESLKEDPKKFILQERKDGTEVNYEAWFYKGTPFLAYCNLENKRKLSRDKGENTGSSQSIGFMVPLESKGVKETIGKMFPFYKSINYTGFADVNVIISEKQQYFLEVCNRFGYDAHPNLFLNLAIDTFANIICDWMDGKIDNFEKRFDYGFGASLSLFIDHPRSGLPIYISEDIKKNFWSFDTYEENEKTFLAGGNEIGYLCAHDNTIEDAAEKLYEIEKKVNYPDKGLRQDLDKTDYPTAPIRRYRALESMGYLEKEEGDILQVIEEFI